VVIEAEIEQLLDGSATKINATLDMKVKRGK
jgi:hypothetical protein